MFKKLVLMFVFLTTAGVNAVADVDQSSMEAISKPGIFKKAYNFCWGKRSNKVRAGIATVALLPSVILLGFLGKDCFDGTFNREELKLLWILIPGISHFLVGFGICTKAQQHFCP